jgi:hypothetical protein
MSIMSERDLECFLCHTQFIAMHLDCIGGPEIIREDCRSELGKLPFELPSSMEAVRIHQDCFALVADCKVKFLYPRLVPVPNDCISCYVRHGSLVETAPGMFSLVLNTRNP